jgi:hypothetical protein
MALAVGEYRKKDRAGKRWRGSALNGAKSAETKTKNRTETTREQPKTRDRAGQGHGRKGAGIPQFK